MYCRRRTVSSSVIRGVAMLLSRVNNDRRGLSSIRVGTAHFCTLKDEAVRGVLLHLLHIRIIVALKKSQCLANLLALNFSIQLQTTD